MDKFLRDVQERLARLGIDPGPIDGIDGPRTRAAIKSFQAANGLATDGIMGPTTTAVLFDQKRPSGDVQEFQVPTIWPTQREVPGFYGEMGVNQTRVEVPWRMRLAWDTSVPITRISLHTKCADSARRALERIAQSYSQAQIKELGLDLFGGTLNVRRVRGGNSWSMHSWGIAIDFDPARNQLQWGRDRARLGKPDAVPFWEAWEAEGWVPLGRARNFDWMHVQAARL